MQCHKVSVHRKCSTKNTSGMLSTRPSSFTNSVLTIGYAYPDNEDIPRTFYSSQDWDEIPLRVQQILGPHVLRDFQRRNFDLMYRGDRYRAEAKVHEIHEGLIEQLTDRMRQLIRLGGKIWGLPEQWKETLTSDTISEMLDETERAYRLLLIAKILELGGCVNTESDASIDRLEQILKSLGQE
ncbi:hypothetical protein BJX66DRAFT_95673 [Aspergillus keveii]|uniref:Uncharacterized protein n=1 Tax=Aspergillus keveii TaxID=714993 RepID=A0ABR4FLM3_9EURO